MKHIISLGAGVQSSTMALMAAEGLIEPMPDAAVFADTKAEPESVYRWLDWLTPRLPFPVHRVTHGSLEAEETRIRISGKTGVRYRRSQIPAYLDGGAPAFRQCTQEYKLRPLHRKYLELADGQAVTQWIGISLDECHRMKMSGKAWLTNRYPLVYDVPTTRAQCLAWMASRGYPQPPRSACIFCPYHNDREWLRLKEKEPDEFARAVAFERRVQDVCDQVGQSRVFLHRSLKPLDGVSFAGEHNLNLFEEECEGMCGV